MTTGSRWMIDSAWAAKEISRRLDLSGIKTVPWPQAKVDDDGISMVANSGWAADQRSRPTKWMMPEPTFGADLTLQDRTFRSNKEEIWLIRAAGELEIR